MNLSKRLKVIASLVPNGSRVCDIGTDHGHLPIYLIRNKIASSVIATDIRSKPLSVAQNNIKISNTLNVETRLCDGLSGVNYDEVDTIIIAGMGGDVISGILNSCDWVRKSFNYKLILQSMSSTEILRKYLSDNGYNIIEEPVIIENGKIYSVISAVFTGEYIKKQDWYYYIGEVSPFKKDGLLYMQKQQKRCAECAKALKNIADKQDEYKYFKKISDDILSRIDMENNNGI